MIRLTEHCCIFKLITARLDLPGNIAQAHVLFRIMDTAVSSVVIVLNNNVRSLQNVHVHSLVNVATHLKFIELPQKQ